MAWAFDVTSNIPRITQSGTDTNLAGIATAITALARVTVSTAYTTAMMRKPPVDNGMWYRCSVAGTTAATAPTYNPVAGSTTTDGTAQFVAFLAPDVRTLGTANHYDMPLFRFNITGQLTNANPQQQNFTCWDLLLSATGATFTSGQWASDGVTPLYDGLHFCATRVGSAGADESTAGFALQLNAAATFIGGECQVAAAVVFATASTPRCYYTRWRNTRDWGGVTSSRFRSNSTTAIFRDCEFFDMAFDLFRMPAEFSVKARGSEYLAQYVGAAFGGADARFVASNLENVDGVYDFDNFASGWVELYNCKQGEALKVVTQHPSSTFWVKHCVPLYQDIVITAKDTSGVVVQDVRFTATESPSNPPTVTFVTAGNLKTWDFRTPLSYQTTTNASGIATSSPVLNVWYWETSFKESLRFPSSTATYQGRAYNYKTVNVPILLGASTAVQASAGMISLDTATTVNEATALAYTGISFVAAGATGGTVTISSNRTLQEVWNAYRAYISQFANRASNDTWNCLAGAMSMGAWNLVVNTGVTLSGSGNVTSLSTTGTVTINGTGQITAIYSSAAGTSTTFQFQNVQVGSSLIIYDASGVTKYFQQEVTTAGTYSYYIAPGTTGTYSWAIEKYGTRRESGSFAANTGGLLFYVPAYAEDVGITQATKATVAGYTTLETNSKVYDYIAYSRLSEQFIKLGQILTRSGTSLEWISGYSVKVKATNATVFSLTSTTFFIKASSLAGDTKYATHVLVPPATLTADTTEVITTEIEDGNGDSSVTVEAAAVSTFEVWKITDATNPDNYATGTLVATVGIGKWRFLHANGFKFVIRDTTTNYRVVVEAEKGIYKAELFFGASVQLAQSAEVSQINTKVDIMQIDLEAIKGTGHVKDKHSLTNIKKKAALAAALSA
jgi:hypothetical protein